MRMTICATAVVAASSLLAFGCGGDDSNAPASNAVATATSGATTSLQTPTTGAASSTTLTVATAPPVTLASATANCTNLLKALEVVLASATDARLKGKTFDKITGSTVPASEGVDRGLICTAAPGGADVVTITANHYADATRYQQLFARPNEAATKIAGAGDYAEWVGSGANGVLLVYSNQSSFEVRMPNYAEADRISLAKLFAFAPVAASLLPPK